MRNAVHLFTCTVHILTLDIFLVISVTLVLLCPLGLKGCRFLKTRNTALPPQTRTFGYPGMSGQSAYKVVCGVYLKKIHQVLVEQQENFRRFRVISRKSCLAHVQGGKLQNKFDTTKYHVYTKLCAKSPALEMTVAYIARDFQRSVTIHPKRGRVNWPNRHCDRCDKDFQKPTIRSQILRQGAPQDTTSYIHPLFFIDI